MNHEFDTWNEIKKLLSKDILRPNLFPKEGQVWMAILGKNIGHEQNGTSKKFSRPVLIIKKFNNHMYWVVPLSNKQKKIDFYYNFTDPYNNQVSAILAQMKLISVLRVQRKMYDFEKESFLALKEKLRGYMT